MQVAQSAQDVSLNTISQAATVSQSRSSGLNTTVLRIPASVCLFTAAAIIESRRLTCLADYDIWWHLRTGAWILQNRAVPHNGLFSQYSDRAWVAYSWGFEVVAAAICSIFGLRGVPLLMLCLNAALAVVLFGLARPKASFWRAVFVSAIGQYAIAGLKPRPGTLSILLFGLELMVLFHSRRTGNWRALFWLPPLFLLWANVHIQFVYGLLALALFLIASLVEHLCRRFDLRGLGASELTLPPAIVATAGAASVLATLLTPYGYRTYQVAWNYAHSSAAYTYIVEMHAMNFRWPEHYARVLLAMAAFFAVGRKRSLDLFGIALLTAGTLLALRQQRDAWFMVLPSVALIADTYFRGANDYGTDVRVWAWPKMVTAALVIMVLAASAGFYIPSSRDALLSKVSATFPVKACDLIRERHLPAPIFNSLNWGGFLIWYLPEYPVAMDGRTDLYGDEIVDRQYKVWDGEAPPSAEPTLINARTLLLKTDTGLAEALRESPGYQRVYGNANAVVFVRMQ